jgi:hypothetical protein
MTNLTQVSFPIVRQIYVQYCILFGTSNSIPEQQLLIGVIQRYGLVIGDKARAERFTVHEINLPIKRSPDAKVSSTLLAISALTIESDVPM